MLELGFKTGQSSACVFIHKGKGLAMSVHGDDFATAGPKPSLDWFVGVLREKYELKESERLGGILKTAKKQGCSTVWCAGRIRA